MNTRLLALIILVVLANGRTMRAELKVGTRRTHGRFEVHGLRLRKGRRGDQ